jgi:phosphoesterase RecJ-like protein
MDSIVQHLRKSRKILIAAHANPDGDAVGSLLAMGRALAVLGKNTTLYNESPIPAVYRFLPSVERITGELRETDGYDTAVVLDCGNPGRIGEAKGKVEAVPCVINLDHHQTNTRFGHLHVVDTSACATAEIVYRLIRHMGVAIDRIMATAIYTGILTDTGSFRFSNTNRAAFSICEEMVAAGVEPYRVAQHVYGTYSLGRIKLLNLALDSIEIAGNGKVSLMTLSQDMLDETGTQREDIDGLINYARRIKNVKVAALIQELEKDGAPPGTRHRYHVSLRSDGEVDVSGIAARYGGGGHPSAAGFNVVSTLSDVKASIVRLGESL